MASSTEEGWEDGTAVAGPEYINAIARSEPDFDSEPGTATAGLDYVENIRKSGDLAADAAAALAAGTPVRPAPVTPIPKPGAIPKVTPIPKPAPAAIPAPAPVVTPRPAPAQRAPTMAFGTPVLLRAPAAAPSPNGAPAPERRTPLPGLGEARPARTTQARRPAPSKFVDQPFDESERKSGVIAVPEDPADERPSRKMPTAAATPLTKERASGPVASDRRSVVQPVVEERNSGAVVQARDGRYGTPSARLPADAVAEDPIVDAGEEDESAGDLDAFDNAETIGQMQAPAPVVVARRPAPLRPTSPAMTSEPLPAMPGYLGGAQPPVANPFAPTAQAIAIPGPLPAGPQPPPQGAMPSSYPMVSADAMQAFRSPLQSNPVASPAPVAVAAPHSRTLMIAVGAAVVIALGIGAYVFLLSGAQAPRPAAATKTVATTPLAEKPVVDKPAVENRAPVAAVTTPAVPPPTAIPTTTTTTKTTTPTKTTVKTKTIAKATTKAMATKKVVKKPVVKKVVKKPAAKKPTAKPCSGLDCL